MAARRRAGHSAWLQARRALAAKVRAPQPRPAHPRPARTTRWSWPRFDYRRQRRTGRAPRRPPTIAKGRSLPARSAPPACAGTRLQPGRANGRGDFPPLRRKPRRLGMSQQPCQATIPANGSSRLRRDRHTQPLRPAEEPQALPRWPTKNASRSSRPGRARKTSGKQTWGHEAGAERGPNRGCQRAVRALASRSTEANIAGSESATSPSVILRRRNPGNGAEISMDTL